MCTHSFSRFSLAIPAVFLGAASLLGCAAATDDGVDDVSSPIIGGTPTSARPEVAQFFPASGGACSSTLISDRTFVSASHCINYQSQQKGGFLRVTGIGDFAIERVFSQAGDLGVSDISYGRVTTFVPVTPATISVSEPSNTWLTAVGYGCTTMRGMNCAPSDRTFKEYFYNGASSSFRAQGDSGGPTFIGKLNDRGPMVRIASGYNWLGNDIGADTVTYRPHMLGFDAALNNDGVSYRVHVQDAGWLPPVQNSAVIGTPGTSMVQGIQIWSPRPNTPICYTAHVANIGWQAEVCDGDQAGTVGQSLATQAIKIRVANGTAHVRYNVYVQGIGWQGWKQDNVVAGTTGQSRRIEAMQVQLF
jgi:hypothetical protein